MTNPVQFDVALRGYDRSQVDALVARAAAALRSIDPALRQAVARDVRSAAFRVALRGYDRAQVDDYFAGILAALHG